MTFLRLTDRARAIETLAKPRLWRGMSLAICRVVEKAVANVWKHAPVSIQNDEEAFDVDKAPTRSGLPSTEDRCGFQVALLRPQSRADWRTTVAAKFPPGRS